MTNKLRTLCVLMTILLLPMAAMAQTTYYVRPDVQTSGDGSTWDTAMTLSDALTQAKAGDQIWVAAGTYKGSFELKSGISLYGGFEGTETSIDQRQIDGDKAYRMTHQAIFSGDTDGQADIVDDVNLIFPGNRTRSGNATHVLTIDLTPKESTGNNNNVPTVVDGITIKGGHADDGNGQGGGILVTGDNNGGGRYIIRRCFFIENYANMGGALYVSSDVKNINNNECLIDRCGFFNNAAGQRGTAENKGGAIYLGGAGTVVNCAVFNNENGGIYLDNGDAKVINSTVTRNTASGIDGSGCKVGNTVIWGNSTLSTTNARPNFNHCAYPEANSGGTDNNGNVYLAAKNNEANGPHFSSPSLKTGFDINFTLTLDNRYPLWTWEPMEATPLVDAGEDSAYQGKTYGSVDLNGDQRVQGTHIDIGAFEYQPMDGSRIRYVKQGGTGTGDGKSWENASGDLQLMIDQLAESGQPGEVWVAAGEYEPLTQLITGTSYSASFRMRDGISVYGGFNADKPETSKTARVKKESGMPWKFENQTVLVAAYYVRNESNPSFTSNKWALTSDSRHVVWFAPMQGEDAFTQPTYLDGVTITGGYAQGGTGLDDFKTDRGAGVYMDGNNTYLTNCIVKENYATGNGGGVYLKGGRVQSTLIYNNSADQNGGAVYVDDQGLVHRSMLTNNSARNGAGVYLDNNDEGQDHPEYLILSTCVVSNNTAIGNGAVYCNEGGVLLQNTITNNNCVTSTDATDPNASQTGGIYINRYALVANSVIWNNRMGVDAQSAVNIPMYAKNPTAAKVRFMYNAISGVNNAVWNNILQEQTLSLVDQNSGTQDDPNSIGPRFEEPTNGFNMNEDFGVRLAWRDSNFGASVITYFWKPIDGSNLWARGMALGQLPSEVVLAPEIDIAGGLFAQKPAVGAFHVNKSNIVPALEDNTLVVYIDADCTEPDHHGSSWATAYRSLNDAISFFAGLNNDDVVKDEEGGDIIKVSETTNFEIRVLEGNLWPRYAFVNEDPKTATLDILAMQGDRKLKIVGGYYRNGGSSDDVQRDPLNYRSQLNGNPDGNDIKDGLYHVVTVEQDAKVELDGFHIINGYAAGTATLQYGAGMLIHSGATVTVANTIFENNTAVNGAAIYADPTATLTLQNCVVNNNTNTAIQKLIINANALTLQHVTIVNNIGAAPEKNGDNYATSFSAGNVTSAENGTPDGMNNTMESLATTGKDGAANFANPTNGAGATFGFNTYLGGYASFRPLTSSADAGTEIINKVTSGATDLTTDITVVNDRDLGGVPDLGAYEADLPKAGRIIYVRQDGTGDGLSWGTAMGDINDAVEKAADYNAKLPDVDKLDADKRAQVWVAAGTYSAIPQNQTCFLIKDGVDVLGAFPNSGCPGLDDRYPLLSQYIHNPDDVVDYKVYETILTKSGNGSNGRILGPEDEDTYNPDKQNHSNFTYETTWDGFTITGGELSKTAQKSGGGGAQIFYNCNLKNCVVSGNSAKAAGSYQYDNARGGGVYCDEGSIINCYIINNEMRVDNQNSGGAYYGGGAYLFNGTMYNCIVANNEIYALYADGAGLFMENAVFYNNTVVNNKAETTGNNKWGRNEPRSSGGITLWCDPNNADGGVLELYNCIVAGNVGYNPNYSNWVYGNKNIGAQQGTIRLYNCLFDTPTDPLEEGGVSITYDENCLNYTNGSSLDWTGIFKNVDKENFSNSNYRLNGTPSTINMGRNIIYEPDGETVKVDLSTYTDMDFTDRIKDCTVDAGAYELENIENTKPDENHIYYVTQNGAGNASGDSPDNAACAMKLQTVLNAAGILKAEHAEYKVVVKVAGYDEEHGGFVYHANTLANENDPQSYSYTVPYGVILKGGYNEFDDNGWKDENRNALAYPTKLSAIHQSTMQNVNGYHAVTFGSKPDNWLSGAADARTVIDGVWLVDGSATALSGGGDNTKGGGAIVPAWAHVRNCVVQGNEAVEGGGLYLMPGATVSGTAVLGNTADDGGGVYVDNEKVNEDGSNRAHIISCTIADNTADNGGGLYLEDGASMQVNTVIWGNVAPSNKNVSGVIGQRYADTQLTNVFGNLNAGQFYPFNDCFVESQEMPSDFENTSMQSDSTIYFADELRTLKEFSPLIKHGVANNYYDDDNNVTSGFIGVFGVAEKDMQGIDRIQTGNGAERVDAGAFAFEGGILPTDLFTRIFVSQTENVKLEKGENMLKYLGKSFSTAFSTLEDALAYVRSMRENGLNEDKEFEILVGSGTYKPIYKRGGDKSSPTVTNNQRLYSFVVPHGVSIYGGFSGKEKYITPAAMQFPDDNKEKVTSIPSDGVTDSYDGTTSLSDILSKRELSDFNGNRIEEPWELANQTILSGNINVSAEVGNVYHVLYTDATDVADPLPVLLDGLTVMDGETFNKLSEVKTQNEQGRGGGLYSNGVGYTINRCRFMNNLGLRGGAVYVRDARLNVVGSIFAGNGWTDTSAETPDNQPARGGAIFIAGSSNVAVSLYAVNSLFVNNETIGEGGAIGSTYAEGVTSYVDPSISIMNCTFAKNKANVNAVIYNHNAKSELTNTLIWGNESEDYDGRTDVADMQISHSASDHDYGKLFGGEGSINILLNEVNNATDGPRFTRPSSTAGIAGNDATNLWNPSGISVVTDKGDGIIPDDNNNEKDAYTKWFGEDENGWMNIYMSKTDGTYERYSGPTLYNEDGTQANPKRTIDIGVYEYQYFSNFQKMPAIYVATEESGDGSGENWANATSDLRGAIAGASHPIENPGARTVYVRDGEYSLKRLSAGAAFVLNFVKNQNLSNSDALTLKGSCTGVGDAQDFAEQTVLRNGSVSPDNLLQVSTNEGKVTIEGFTFINNTGINANGVNAGVSDNAGSLTLKNCAFRTNIGSGMNITGATGKVLIYNTLFADGGTGLNVQYGKENITLVNTTFANNNKDMSEELTNVYNSVSWNNRTQYMVGADGHNKVFDKFETKDAAKENNEDIQNGPNFVDPLNEKNEARDYHIRPSLTLLNKGENNNYALNVLGSVDASLTDERDLGNNARLTDETIDIGAYEYEAPLQPIVYVKKDLTIQNRDGKSWKTALDDLQAAADLAGIYANGENNRTGYVFADYNVDVDNLRVTLPRTKVYGGMNNQVTDISVYGDDGQVEDANIKGAVEDLLSMREGLIERTDKSVLTDVSISGNGSVVDGFVVNGTATVSDGYLSTSIVNQDVNVREENKGIIYNSLVYGSVNGVKAVNVTATGTISGGDGNANNRTSVTETNTYVTDDDWKYQLMETSTKEKGGDIDAGTDQKQTSYCINMVGHNRDIAGNKRIRNVVDNGCFETWDINTGDSTITAKDYPHGKSVVYVREDRELSINEHMPEYTESTPFNPGVLLLEHQAGLRGNGNSIGLSYVIMERNVPDGGVDMAYAPFQATMKNVQGNPTRYYYDGAARAAYNYTFDANNGSAWTKTETETYNYNMGGLLLDNTTGGEEAKVRFVGKGDNVYLERPNVSKFVTLDVNNFSDPWTANNHTGNKFTAKENMSWNLFGSPYLCAMNYDDMEYGRVIYGYQNNGYVTVKTYNDDGSGDVPDGYIPAGDAIFTQTAALSESETFTVEQPVDGNKPTGTAYGGMEDLKVTITRTGETRAAEDGGTDGDVLQLNAVAPEMSRTDFDMGSDGVKWMADGVAQIYAVQGGGRYSLLSAVNIDGKVSVGVTLPEAGMYTIAVPDDCLADGYESVILEDAANGRKTNLLEGGYDFTSTAAGDIEGRFTISFNRMVDDMSGSGIRAWSPSSGAIRVEGVEPGDRVSIYSVDGIQTASRTAVSSTEDFSTNIVTIAVVTVERDGNVVKTVKLKMKY